MRNKLTFTAIALAALMTACNSNNNSTVVPTSVELPGTVDIEAFAANVESISVTNLQMDNDWAYIFDPELSFADNYLYMFENFTMKLICFDRYTGEKLSSRAILGNGPGEIVQFIDMFCIGDTFCVRDEKHIIRQYNSKGAFLGKLHEFDESFSGYNHIMPLKNGDYALLMLTNRDKDTIPPVILLTDKSFNVKSRYFITPRDRSFLTVGYAPPFFVNDDTVRFFISYDSHLYSLCGDTEKSIELALPNPLTAKIAKSIDIQDPDYVDKMNSYDGKFHDLGESGRFVVFRYKMNDSYYLSMLDKRTNDITSIVCHEERENSTSGIMAELFHHLYYKHTDGKYLYGKYFNKDLAKLLEGHDDLLDARLKETQAEYRAYLERNAEYLNGLEPEDRDEANVILKIKLKD